MTFYMKPILVLAALLTSVLPTCAQSSKVWTNADLSAKPVTWTRTVTPAELAGLQARAFSAPPEALGPTVYIAPWSGDGPSGFPADHNAIVMAGSRSSFDADDLWRDPVTAYGLQHPIEAAYGQSFRSGRDRLQHPGREAQRGFPATPPTTVRAQSLPEPRPSVTTSPSGAGRRVR